MTADSEAFDAQATLLHPEINGLDGVWRSPASQTFKYLLPAWETFRNATDIAPIRDEAHYQRMVAILEALLDEATGDENHQTEHHPLPGVTGVQALQFLMAQHGINQSDLHEIGSQGVVSEILAGKRELNIRQVRALSESFRVSSATFV